MELTCQTHVNQRDMSTDGWSARPIGNVPGNDKCSFLPSQLKMEPSVPPSASQSWFLDGCVWHKYGPF